MVIRRALPEDAPALLGLIRALAEYEKLTPPAGDAADRLARDMDTKRFQAFLAELNGVPVGYALAFETYGTFIAAPKYYVEDIFIMPEHRGNGLGHAFFAVLAAEATYRGAR
jgi:L-amino acid N-acyltransferase YncA